MSFRLGVGCGLDERRRDPHRQSDLGPRVIVARADDEGVPDVRRFHLLVAVTPFRRMNRHELALASLLHRLPGRFEVIRVHVRIVDVDPHPALMEIPVIHERQQGLGEAQGKVDPHPDVFAV